MTAMLLGSNSLSRFAVLMRLHPPLPRYQRNATTPPPEQDDPRTTPFSPTHHGRTRKGSHAGPPRDTRPTTIVAVRHRIVQPAGRVCGPARSEDGARSCNGGRAAGRAPKRDGPPGVPGGPSCDRPRAALCFAQTWALAFSSSTTDGSASVLTSPSSSPRPSAILRRMRRMTLPERVLGRPAGELHLVRRGDGAHDLAYVPGELLAQVVAGLVAVGQRDVHVQAGALDRVRVTRPRRPRRPPGA